MVNCDEDAYYKYYGFGAGFCAVSFMGGRTGDWVLDNNF